MKHGDRVTGVPCHPEFRSTHPMVTGYYDSAQFEIMGENHEVEFVTVGEVAVDCDEIRPATAAEADTVLD